MPRKLFILVTIFVLFPAMAMAAEYNKSILGTPVRETFFFCVISAFVLGLISFFGVFYRRVLKSNKAAVLLLVFFILAGLILRLFIAYNMSGFKGDIESFTRWAYNSSRDFTHFYSATIINTDGSTVPLNGAASYTPAYIYILAIIGTILRLFNVGSIEGLSQLFIKLPAILADLGLAILLYNTFKRRFIPQVNLALVLLIVFNPLLIINSSVWGQVDSIFVFLLAATVILLVRNHKYHCTISLFRLNLSIQIDSFYLSVFFMAITLLFKPQAIFFLPVFLFELIRRKSFRQFAISAAVGIGTFFAFVIPFVPPSASSYFPLGGTPLWIINLYMNAGDSIRCATVNALNLFFLLGKNWVDEREIFILGQNFSTWGYIFMGIGYLIVAVLFFAATLVKNKKDDGIVSALVLSPILMNIAFFMFGPRMHERYMIPAAVLLVFAFAYIRDIRILFLFICFSITNFMNVLYIMLLSYNNTKIIQVNFFETTFSILNVLLTLFAFYVAFDILVRGHTIDRHIINHHTTDQNQF